MHLIALADNSAASGRGPSGGVARVAETTRPLVQVFRPLNPWFARSGDGFVTVATRPSMVQCTPQEPTPTPPGPRGAEPPAHAA
jgi:hypothetical protein